MALLKHASVLWWLGCSACASSASLGHVEVWLSDCSGPNTCNSEAPSEHFAVQAFFDPSVSRYSPHGLYAYFELPRANGSRGLFEIDVPTDTSSAAALERYEASYRELAGDKLRFDARVVRGQIALPSSLATEDTGSCACDEAAFALRFSEAGSDGEVGTDDDRVRELTLGRIGRSDEACATPLRAVDADDDGLRLRVHPCTPLAPDLRSSRASEPAPAPARTLDPASSCAYYGCYPTGSVTVVAVDDPGCGSSTSDSAGCGSSGDDGCGDNAASSDSPSDSSAGCSGDSSSDSDSSSNSGCEGDTSDEHASCAVVQTHARSHKRHGSSFVGTGLPLLLICAWQVLRTSAARRRASRVPTTSCARPLHVARRRR